MTLLKFPGRSLNPVPDSPCPHCNRPISASSWQEHGHMPEVGDLTVCTYCAHVLRFGKGLRLVGMTERDERQFLRENPDIQRQVRKVAREQLIAMGIPT